MKKVLNLFAGIALTPILESMFFGVRWKIATNG